MTLLSGASAALKVVAVVAAGGALAGAIALAATRGNGGAPPPLAAATPTVTPAAERTSPPGSLAKMRALGDEARVAALAKAPGVYLFSVIYARGQYTFLYTGPEEPGAPLLVSAAGPNDQPGKPRWEVKTEIFLPTPRVTLPEPLDLKALKRSAPEVLRLFAQKVGQPESSIFLQVEVDSETHEATWVAGPVGGDHAFTCRFRDFTAKWDYEPC